MKKTLTAIAMLAAIVSTMPAHAYSKTIQDKRVTFKALPPCAEVCSYNAPNQKDPQTFVDAWNPTSPASAADKQTAFACTAPSPAGSFTDLVLTAPKGSNYLVIVGTPDVDWDIVLCNKPKTGNNGSMVAFEDQAGYTVSTNPDEICVVGCVDTIKTAVVAGRRYVLRAYDFSDPNDLPVRYTFKHI